MPDKLVSTAYTTIVNMLNNLVNCRNVNSFFVLFLNSYDYLMKLYLPVVTFPSRLVCVVPPAVAPPPHLYAVNPPVPYSLAHKSLQRWLQEASTPHNADIHHLVTRRLFHFPDMQLMQMDSGWPGIFFCLLGLYS